MRIRKFNRIEDLVNIVNSEFGVCLDQSFSRKENLNISELVTDESMPDVAMLIISNETCTEQVHLLVHDGLIEDVFYEKWPPEPSTILEML